MPDAGVIVDIEVVTGEEADFARMAERLDALEITLGRRPGAVTADKAYGIGKVYAAQSERPSRSGPVGAAQSERHITAVIPPRPSTRQAKAKGFPTRRFHYNARRDIVRCPRKKVMPPGAFTKAHSKNCAAVFGMKCASKQKVKAGPLIHIKVNPL